MNITTVQYCKETNEDGNLVGENVCINATINGDTVFVPLDPANRHYAEILKQVEDGTLVIADAE